MNRADEPARWRDALLAALSEGHRMGAACGIARVSAPTVKRYREQDPDLDAAIKAALGSLDGRSGPTPGPRDTSWRAVFLAELERSGSVSAAAQRAGTTTTTVGNHKAADDTFAAQIQQARDRYRRRVEQADAAYWKRVGQEIVRLIDAGVTVPEAAAEAGVALHKLVQRRRRDSDLDKRIRAAQRAYADRRYRQWLAAWEEPFLAALAQGETVTRACEIAGVLFVDMYKERRRNSDFETKVRKALTESGRGFDSEARRMLMIRLHNGAALDEALASAGVTRDQLDAAAAADPRLAEKLRPHLPEGHGKAHRAQKLKCPCRRCREYRNAAERKRRARRLADRFPADKRESFLTLVKAGTRVVDAATQVGVTWQTVYAYASVDREFSRRLDAATRAHCTCEGSGRTGVGRQRCDCPESRRGHARETARLRRRRT